MAQSMSSLQHGLMELFRSNSGHLPIDTLSQVKQTTVRSFLIRKWLEPTPDGEELVLTKDAKQAAYEFDNANILRKAANAPMTSYLDLVLSQRKKRGKVIPMKKRRSAAA